MLIRGDIDLNSTQGSLNDILRNTILNQELVFRDQVHQLHHLYKTQKMLMENLGRKEYHRNNVSKASAESNLTNSTRDEPRGLFEGHRSMCEKLQWRPPGLGHPLVPCNKNMDPAELKLSLRFREDSRREGSTKRNWFDVGFHSSSPIVIDLEEDESDSNPFDQGLNGCSGGISVNKLSTRRQEFSSYEAGILDLNKTQPDDSLCLTIDPMVVHPSTACPSHAFRGLVVKIKEGTVFFSAEKKEHGGNFSILNFTKENEKGLTVDGFRSSEMDGVSLEATTVTSSESDLCEVVGSSSNDPKSGSDGCILKFLNSRSHTFAASKQATSETTKVEPRFPYSVHSKKTDEHGNISSYASKQCCIGDNGSGSVKTILSEVEFRNSNPFSSDQFSTTHVGSQGLEILMGEQDQRSSDSSESEHKCANREEESSELDALASEAAEALLGMSLESSFSYQNSAGKVGESNKVEKDSEKPHYSCDFFELMTLTLTESSVDEYSVSSNPSEVSVTENKDGGLKLRRGRRLKDFQKDILPNLSSLSRHEIREDINIMEGVLRSREYKRIQAKMADGHGWCTPVRSKRSRLNHGTRRKRIA